MFRFFVDKKINDSFELSKETLKHINVARVVDKQFICIFEKEFYICKLENDNAKIISKLKENNEHQNQVIIAPAIIDTKRFEWLLQKATELGATRIIPTYTTNVSKKISGDITKKIERWNKITFNAAEQSFRNVVPIVEMPVKFENILDLNIPNKYIAHEKETPTDVMDTFSDDVLFLVGPEGGFTDMEVTKATEKNFKSISLGKRILRAETASIFLLSRVKQK